MIGCPARPHSFPSGSKKGPRADALWETSQTSAQHCRFFKQYHRVEMIGYNHAVGAVSVSPKPNGSPSFARNIALMTRPITNRPLKRAGRKPINPPADAAERIREMAAAGRSLLSIGARLGVCKHTFNGWLERDPDLQVAFDLGRADKEHELFERLDTQSKSGNTTATIFLLKGQFGWKEGEQQQAARANITINLPGAMSLQQFQSIGREKANG